MVQNARSLAALLRYMQAPVGQTGCTDGDRPLDPSPLVPMTFRIWIFLTVCVLSCEAGRTDDVPLDFAHDVYAVLRRSCFECHGEEKQEGDLRLDTRPHLLDSETVVPGQPMASELLRRISLPAGHDEIMPAIGEPLSKREIAAIKRWIADGALWPEDFVAGTHWSYVRPARPDRPNVSQPMWPRNDIDHFVMARLDREAMSPSPEASPETLVRRLYLDLIGLPPTPETVNDFVADPSEAAYESLIDDLLSRPQFGERWARPWLDLARYADSHGFQRDNLREIWAYRDWVIRAFNTDMPFDRFTIEQIAGDLLPDATESQKIATGFHRCTPTNVEAGSLPEETRIEQVIDRVNTTAAVWLGTTLECAQCHDHKYDPFSQRDYYRLLAFYNNTEREADRANPKTPSSIKFLGPKMPVSNPEKDAQRAALQTEEQRITERLKERRKTLNAGLAAWVNEFARTAADAPALHLLSVVEFTSKGANDSHRILDDGSVLLTGKQPPPTDLYTVKVTADIENIRAIRLDVLTHDSLPGKGPGRGDAKKTNFVLNEFTAATESGPFRFVAATADFSQNNWDVAEALDPRPKTGWAIAPQFGKPHWAQFELETPQTVAPDRPVTIQLRHDYGGARSIGRFRLSAVTGNLNGTSVSPDLRAAAQKPADQWTKQDRSLLLNHCVNEDSETRNLNTQLARVKKRMADLQADTTLVMVELAEPRMSYVFDRGDYRNHGDVVTPGTPAVLHPIPNAPHSRLTLARWLVDPQNPLVARVTVNRWWMEIFGRGIVSTPEDFGIKGELPSHPQLLDWLAVEFMENGWSLKKLLRTIVSSSTYRQSSFVTREQRARDDRNELLARGPRFRMSAEMIRDNILAASGLISLKQFGPSVRPFQPDGVWSKVGGEAYAYKVSPGEDQYRRGVYVVLKRGAPYPSFVNFDASARLACTVRRSRTNTPLQALTLLNDPVYVEAAEALARRVLSHADLNTTENRLRYAFQLCTARQPDSNELGTLLDLLETERSIQRAAVTGKATVEVPAGTDKGEFAAWTAIASTLINLHETITRN